MLKRDVIALKASYVPGIRHKIDHRNAQCSSDGVTNGAGSFVLCASHWRLCNLTILEAAVLFRELLKIIITVSLFRAISWNNT